MGRAERMLELLLDHKPQVDRLLAAVAAIDPGAPSEAAMIDQLDAFAGASGRLSGPDDLLAHVFGGLGFRGDTAKYYDAKNSMLHHVIDRRVGIPLSLAVVAAEIGRRLDIALSVIGLPGHVVLSDGSGEIWFDPFRGGRRLTRAGCEAIAASARPGVPFDDRVLRPMAAVTIVGRTLENLRAAHLRSGDRSALIATLELRARLPGAPPTFGVEFATALASFGRLDAAAEERDRLATIQPDHSDEHQRVAQRLRASRN